MSRSLELNRRDLMKLMAAAGVTAFGYSLSTSPALAEQPVRGGKLRLGLKGGSTGDSLDPTVLSAAVQYFMAFQFGNCLVERGPDGKLMGELAESWEPRDGGKTWVFRLRKGIKFHNGAEFTADDIMHAINRHIAPDSRSSVKAQLSRVERVTSNDPLELTVELKQIDVNFPYLLTSPAMIAVPKDAAPDSAIGTGPYVVDEAEPGVRYVLHRNPDYFKSDRAWYDEVEILVLNDETARISALVSGTVDAITLVPPQLVSGIQKAPGLKIANAASSTFNLFVMRCDIEPFNNKDLRLAMKYAVDREQMVKAVLSGYGDVGNDSPINEVFPLYSDDLPVHSFDIEKAKDHYRKSGHSGPIQLQVSDAAFPGAVDAALLFQQSAARVGIEIAIKREPADGYWDDVWLKSPFCVSYWAANSTEDQALSIAYETGAPWNDTYWSNPEFDKLLAEARSELDEAKRKAIYRKAISMVQEDGGHIIFMFPQTIVGYTEKLAGFELDHFGATGKLTERSWFRAS
ncbi:MAG TPA: ABC transporter substrate-binding protein [Xanthomonadaceae bacterium]|nr:ABC transporter substrate-binding protein [Xanthomonadaceae bacterium]